MCTQVTWQQLVIGSPYWNTVVIVVEFSFLVCTVLFTLPAFGLTLLSPLHTRMTLVIYYLCAKQFFHSVLAVNYLNLATRYSIYKYLKKLLTPFVIMQMAETVKQTTKQTHTQN